jgi:hypothetical protein
MLNSNFNYIESEQTPCDFNEENLDQFTRFDSTAIGMNVIEPNLTIKGGGNVVIKCEVPSDIASLVRHGYLNAFADHEYQLMEITFDALQQLGVSIVIYFSDVIGVDFDVHSAKELASNYGITLCEVKLPFRVVNLENWDEFQWCLFDKRITQSLSILGVRNEKYQS